MANLRELASYYRELQRRIEDNGGEVTDEDLEDLTRFEQDIDSKVDAIAVLITDAEMWMNRHKADSAESLAMAKVRENQIARLKEWLHTSMDEATITRAGRKYPWRITRNATPSFRWTRIGEPIPEGFRRVKPEVVELDVEKCRQAYKEADNSSMFLPDGIEATRGTHVQPAYRKPKKGTDDESC